MEFAINVQKKSEIIEFFSDKDILLNIDNKKQKAKLSGSKLDFPIVSTLTVNCEISWALALRLMLKVQNNEQAIVHY